MNGFKGFKMWVAVKQHFTTKKFDVFVNKGRMKGSFEKFFARTDYDIIEYICSKFTEREMVLYLASNFIYGNENMMWDSGVAIANYNLFISRRQQLNTIVFNDIRTLRENNIQLTDGVSIIRYLTQNKITVETVSIINQFHNLTDQLRTLPIGTILEPLLMRIDKSKGFIKPSQKMVDFFNKVFAVNC